MLAFRHMAKLSTKRMLWIKGTDLGRLDKPQSWPTAPLCVIDDLQLRTIAGAQSALELVSLRIEADLPLIITTPILSPDDLAQAEIKLCGQEIGLTSRLFKGWVQMQGEDRRLNQQAGKG